MVRYKMGAELLCTITTAGESLDSLDGCGTDMARRVEVTNYGRPADDEEWLRPWELLSKGRNKEALLEMSRLYERTSNASNAISYGVVMLVANEYDGAFRFFLDLSRKGTFNSESECVFAGVSRWCVGCEEEAVKLWRKGSVANFAPAGNCTQSALLIWTASIILPHLVSRGLAQSTLESVAGDPRIETWPGTLAQWVAGLIDRDTLESSKQRYVRQVNPKADLHQRTWLIKYYEELLLLAEGKYAIESFSKSMEVLADTTAVEWRDTSSYTLLVRQAEFFIARNAGRQRTSV